MDQFGLRYILGAASIATFAFIVVFYAITSAFFDLFEGRDAYAFNSASFVESGVPAFGTVGVAISNNIGTYHAEVSAAATSSLSAGIALSDALGSTKDSQSTYISQHLEDLQAYQNILTVDVKNLMNEGSDRRASLEAYIDLLDYWNNKAATTIADLSNEQSRINANLETVGTQIQEAQSRLATAFDSFEGEKVVEINDEIGGLRERQQRLNAHRIFIQNFGSRYENLNEFNRVRYETLVANKQSLISGTFVTIPEVGTGYLEELNLIRNTNN